MTPLTFVEPTEVEPTLNILLYGPPGTGKTMGACSAPGPILVLNAEGPGAIRYARNFYGDKIREVVFTGEETLTEAFLYLREGTGGEKTVIVDTIGEVYRVLLEQIGGERPKIQHYGDVNTKLERFVRALRDLSINVVLIAHEQVDDSEGEATRRPMTGGKKLPEQIMAQADVVAYTGVVPATDSEPRRYVGQLVEGLGRRAKDRSGSLGDSRDLDLTEWIEIATSTNGNNKETKEK